MILTSVLRLISFCSREVVRPWAPLRSLRWHDASMRVLIVALPDYFFLRGAVLHRCVLLFLSALARRWYARICRCPL